MTGAPHSRLKLMAVAVGSWIIAAGAGYAAIVDSPPPALASLAPVEGVADSTTRARYDLEIALVDDARVFAVANKTGHVQQVETALHQWPGERVTLWADVAHPYGPAWEAGKNHYSVFAVVVGDRMVMSWDDAAAGWHSDNRVAWWLAGGFLLSGAFLMYCARQLPR
jgi:hypothetical protein